MQAPISKAQTALGWLVVSGQVGAIDGVVVGGGIAAECVQALANLEAVLVAHGAQKTDVVKATVFLTSMDDYATMNEVYADFFGEHRPARSGVAVAGLPLGAHVEIEAWCVAPSDARHS